METEVFGPPLAHLSTFVAEAMGLHFPPARWPDLERGVTAAARAQGFEGDAAACVRWILEQPPAQRQLDELAKHLTVGETYFFRERRHFDLLAEHILPPLIQQRRGGEKRLRIWCAACCTGEEAYSIAILLRQALADWPEWKITLLATDINPSFLRKAEAGVFSQWSFRDAPPALKARYFRALSDGHFEILPELKRMVTFTQLNLAEDVYPSLANDTNAMDVIFCRNVLMYFTPEQARKVIEKLHRATVAGGWLIVSPSELLNLSSSPYDVLNLQGSILHRKDGGQALFLKPSKGIAGPTAAPKDAPVVAWPLPALGLEAMPATNQKAFSPPAPEVARAGAEPSVDRLARAATLYAEGHYEQTAAELSEMLACQPEAPGARSLLVHSLANEGKLTEALKCCDQWVAIAKLDASAHYLRATILQELGDADAAIESLRKALFLDRHLVLAHFALGNISRGRKQASATGRHFQNTLRLLRGYRPEYVLADSGGMTAGRLTQIVDALLDLENTQ